MVIKNRLPGISFRAEPPTLEEKLPRMDIAAFVGFASSGPLNIPVPVEDMARFRDIFGDDLALAWDTSTQKVQYAYLAQAVEAFFNNGGKRCWIVRIGDDIGDDKARSNRFLLPGLICADDDTYLPALASARSEGSWSDTLRVNTVLQGQVVNAANFNISRDDTFKYIVDITANNQIIPGDLLQLNFDDNEVSLFLVVEALEVSSHKGGYPVRQVRGNKGYWFRRPSVHSPYLFSWDEVEDTEKAPGKERYQLINKLKEKFELDWLDPLRVINRKTGDGNTIKVKGSFVWPPSPQNYILIKLNDSKTRANLTISTDKRTDEFIAGWKNNKLNIYPSPTNGDAVLLTPEGERSLSHCSIIPDNKPFYKVEFDDLPIERIPVPGSRLRIDMKESPCMELEVTWIEVQHPGKKVVVIGMDGLWQVKVQELIEAWKKNSSNPEISTAYRLSFDLWVWRGEVILSHLNDLAFNKLHPRFWGNLPSDSKLFQLQDGKSIQPSYEMKVSDPRFPLAGPEENAATYLPFGMPIMPDPDTSQGPFDPIKENTEVLRNGLESFKAEFFLEKELMGIGSKSLLNEANYRYYLKNIKKNAPLHGLHSLLPVDEVTTVAVPDAVYCGREYAGPSFTELLPAPKLRKIEQEKDSITLSWSEVTGAEAYTLQEGTDPDFTRSVTSIETSDTKHTSSIKKKNCPLFYYYRVRALRGGKVSPWSNTRYITMPLSEFEDCIPELLPSPILTLSKTDDYYSFRWNSVEESYLFSWNDNPGLITFLKTRYGIVWVENAEIQKSNKESINVSHGDNSLTLKLDAEITKATRVNLTIDDGRTDEFITRMENGKLNIYEESIGYILQEAEDPAFDTTTTIYEGNSLEFSIRCRNKGIYYYRIRTQKETESGPWSETLVAFPALFEFKQEFIEKIIELRRTIDGKGIEEARDEFFLILLNMMKFFEDHISDVWRGILSGCWSGPENKRKVLFKKLKTTEFFKDTTTQYSWDNALKDVCNSRESGSTLISNLTPVQIQKAMDNLGDIDSNQESSFFHIVKNALGPLEQAKWALVEPENYDNLLKVQQALLHFCAARGDMMAVLTLPRLYGEKESLTHVTSLVLEMEDKHVLSFGAIYHPWIYTRSESSSILRLIPPDGAVCGTMAARAISRGAWIAPANVPVKNAVSLNPVINNGSRDRLFTAQVNLIRQEPQGFFISGACTLCPETELQPINVRRLLILLRRLVLREGTAYIFQPNDENFRHLIRHKFEQLLSNLYIRGAFTGDRPEAAYRIVTDNSINTQKSLDMGRFIIELRISPSRPMTFITLRLVQTGQEMLEIQEM